MQYCTGTRRATLVLAIDTNTDSIKLFCLQDEVVASVQSTVQSVEVGMKFLCCSCTIHCEWVRAQRAEEKYTVIANRKANRECVTLVPASYNSITEGASAESRRKI